VDRYGADTARCYVLFAGPPQHSAEWSGHGIEGVYRFLHRVWRLTAEVLTAPGENPTQDQDQDQMLERARVQAVRQVTADMEDGFAFNTAIAALMKLAGDCGRAVRDGASPAATAQTLATLASLLQPFAPHLASEVYYQITGERVWTVPWPTAEDSPLPPGQGTAEIACQVNGKLRGRLTVPAAAGRDEVEQAALAAGFVRAELAGRVPARVVVVPGRLVNIVL
jgi:leucyl-tRNA synthetase